MSAWWESLRPGTEERVVLVQVDLKGHSPWAAGQTTEREPAKDRTEFATSLSVRAGYEGFDCLYWLGDGGVFARHFKGHTEDADAAVAVGDVVFRLFSAFQKSAEGAHALSLRVTATLITLIAHPVPSHWCSADLNEFLKYERDIGLAGAFVITQDLYRQLSAQTRVRFSNTREVVLPTQSSTVYIDSQHPYEAKESTHRFSKWLHDNKYLLPIPTFPSDPIDPSIVCIGKIAVLHTALTELGYTGLQVVQADYNWNEFTEQMSAVREWHGSAKHAYEHHGASTAPLRLTFPTTDFPDLVIEYALAEYWLTHSFHDTLLARPDLRQTWLQTAFAYRNRVGRAIPGGLAVEAAVIFSGASSDEPLKTDKYLLLAHRSQRHHGYFGDHWSCSYGEQFLPVKSSTLRREHPPDRTLIETAVRGLREEFLTDKFTKGIGVQLHAMVMQLDLLNITGLGVATLSDTSFAEILDLWPQALDSAEHDALAALPLRRDVLLKALQSNCPGDIEALLFSQNFGPKARDPWIPTAHAELACCLWLLDSGLL
jgi:hypothetical protein